MVDHSFFLSFKIDCEATQPSIQDASLGERSLYGFVELLEHAGLKGTFFCIPSELIAHASIFREVESQSHEIGLHIHPADQGYDEFLGIYGPDLQEKIISEAADVFAQKMGRKPLSFCSGYGSSNDYTFPVLEKLEFRHGQVGIPTRILPECCSIGAGMPLGAYYPHRYFRVIPGDVNFVQVSNTIDPESRMWGGKHPQDLRVELVDAKNHWYTMHKAVERQLREKEQIPYILGTTHNTFDYSNPNNFRRQTIIKMIEHAKKIFEKKEIQWIPGTIADIAAAYRKKNPYKKCSVPSIKLDTRGR